MNIEKFQFISVIVPSGNARAITELAGIDSDGPNRPNNDGRPNLTKDRSSSEVNSKSSV